MKEDLRVIKTKRSIKHEMTELLQKKPVEKISVTELAAQAMINKGTFYLHYKDIYALYYDIILDYINNSMGSLDYYEEFFTSPHEFVEKFLYDFKKNEIKKAFPFFDVSKEKIPIPYLVTETLLTRLMSTGCIKDTLENRIKVQCCISTLITPLFHFDSSEIDLIIDVVSEILCKTFEPQA